MVSAIAVLTSAISLWKMGDTAPSSFSVHGDVRLGVPLQGIDKDASITRGGDGFAADFNDGWIRVSDGPDLTGSKVMTLYIRMQNTDGQWNSPVISQDNPSINPMLYGNSKKLEYYWKTTPIKDRIIPDWKIPDYYGEDLRNGILRIGIPVKLINPADWHDVVIRFNEANLEMFVDGVLVDEEWPHGGLESFKAPFLIGAGYVNGELKSGFKGQIDHIAIWNRALSDQEITALCGGKRAIAKREVEMFGPKQASLQYWKPRGYNSYAGDCMPFYHDGTFHLFYLFDRRHHGSKWGLGAHQYAHVTSTDLIHWKHQPMALPIIKQWECSMGTGDIVWDDGTYYIFYTDCGERCEFTDKPQTGSCIYTAKSKDGIHFTKDLKAIMAGHDCKVSRDPQTGEFQLIRYGTNLLTSMDLVNWTEQPGEFVQMKGNTSTECPNLFEWNGWFYYLLGRNALWKSRSPKGPWTEIDPVVYDGLLVPKVAQFKENRRILTGSLCDAGWGGHLVLRELIQYPDGNLGMKWLKEQTPAVSRQIKPEFEAVRAGANGDSKSASLESGDQLAIAALTGLPQNCMIKMQVNPTSGIGKYGICVRGTGNYEDGAELRFEPAESKIQWGRPVSGKLANSANGDMSSGDDYTAYHFTNIDKPFELKVIVYNNIVDVEIDGKRTLISRRYPTPTGDRLFMFCQNGKIDFKNIEIRKLTVK